MGKITVNHYLNTSLKPSVLNNETYYKVYFLLRHQNKNTRVKSLTNIEVTEREFNKILNNKNHISNKHICNEIELVHNIIQEIERFRFPFDIKIFNDFWQIASYPIIERLTDYINWVYEKEFELNRYLKIPNTYLETNNDTLLSVLSKLSNFVIDNELLIRDEIFLGQFKDNNILKSLNLVLGDNKTIYIWQLCSQEFQDILKNYSISHHFEPIKHDTIQYLVSNLMIDRKFKFNISKLNNSKIKNSPDFFTNIINSYTGG